MLGQAIRTEHHRQMDYMDEFESLNEVFIDKVYLDEVFLDEVFLDEVFLDISSTAGTSSTLPP